MKIIAILLVYFAIAFQVHAQVPSPENFLGYKVGTKYTPYYKILSYVYAVEKAAPQMVKVEKYGETYEGRDLVVVYVTQPENMQRLEEIRTNNLKLANIINDGKNVNISSAPALVWLSYNVHGNEPSSSEAAMLTLYALVNPSNAETKEYLKNTVVIIDPCLNPDGRDRYVNWYKSASGEQFNADPQSREHAEPWPRGRTNHYNFDLNRDWAWQTQQESRFRVKKYNEWLPQVHVDFHEQGYNSPYYFAPAAEPFHKVITNFQRDFQTRIGRNNASYFDANGWLYFTRQIFDLFYPSYGDTYPTYNGSIGMTYEQGGIDGGLAIKTDEGDTLTLVDRALHHFTTSLSTIEISSKNATQLVTEFKKFFNEGYSEGDYKTYVLSADDPAKIREVITLLDNNGIQYGKPDAKSYKGFNYYSGKEESFSGNDNTLAISALQPKGKLVKVLFEPQSVLSDSATYDITAWAVPYAYGIKAYGVKEQLSLSPYNKAAAITDVTSSYGLLIPYNSFSSAQLLSELLQQKVKVRYALKPFTYKGTQFNRGTLIITRANNIEDWNTLTNAAGKKFGIQPVKVESGFMDVGSDFGSPDVRLIKAPNVAVITGNNVSSSDAGEVWSYFDNSLHYPLTQLDGNYFKFTDLSDYDVLILPGGRYTDFGDDEKNKIKDFVSMGGKVIAMDQGAAKLLTADWAGFKLKEEDKKDTVVLKKYADLERDELRNAIPGAIYKVNLDNTHPLAFGYPDYYYTLKLGNEMYEYAKDAWNVGTINASGYVSGFVGSELKNRLKDGMVLGAKSVDEGNIVLLADNPLFRLFWQNGKLMFANAVFLVGQ